MILRTCWTAFQPSSKTEGGAEVVATASNGIGAIRDTKVLLVSADDDHQLGLCALDCGADGFIWKGLIGRPVQETDPVDVWQTCSRKPHLVGSDHTAKSRIRLVTK